MKTISKPFWALSLVAGVILLWPSCRPSRAASGSGVLKVASPAKLMVRPGNVATAVSRVVLRSGYHVNSDRPGDEYLVPLRLTWNAAPLEVAGVKYPEPEIRRYPFAEKPLPVFTGSFEIRTRFRAPDSAPRGPGTITGKLRYQACTEKLCLPPKTVSISLPVEIE